jgi:hypothetical protein
VELVIVSLISGIFTLIIVVLLQKFWVTKWNLNYDFEKWKIEQRRKGKGDKVTPKNPAPVSPLGNIAQLLPILQGLTKEQIDMFKEFLAPGETEPGEPAGLLDTIIEYAEKNPEQAKAFIEGISGKIGQGGQAPGGSFES